MHYLDLPLLQIHQALVEKKVTPLELTQEALRRAKASDVNAFELLLEKEALEFAASLTEPEEDNVLWGIPYLAKDNFSTKGIVTTGSSNILDGYRPLFDATVIAALKERKCVLLGKTTLDELAMGGSGAAGHLGKTFNPWDPTHQRMIGGSSSGSAAAMALGIVPFALGSDTGDSVRKPASYGGVIGLKPTWGRISRYGLFPFAPSLDHVGYFTRYAEDAAILLSALAGRDLNDSTSSERPVDDYWKQCKAPFKGARIAVLPEIVDSLSDEVVRKTFVESLKKLEQIGCVVEEVPFGKALLESIYPSYIVISCAEATSNDANLDGIKFGPFHEGKTYHEVMMKARTSGFSELIKRRFVIGSFCLMKENQEDLFLLAQRNRARLVERTNQILADHDFIVLPTASSIAPKFEDVTNRLSERYRVADNHLILANFAGLPSISLPLGYEEGMPFGVSLMGRAFEEGNLLSFACAYERLTGLAGAYYGKEGK